ncbi:hypothetical protein CK556_01725 [Mesoplasma chauliocola]|uniref:Uncharacterized protein n=1 Tax=Mesoplasma chauliocola TaxID=216427 RepID=A0A249SN16_9MOLU|nr:PhoH family protein [Mesoplasma chauliocola]ASZ09074.1 hypothetical protein CK556_01725 [Mesoplasma chauliocola]
MVKTLDQKNLIKTTSTEYKNLMQILMTNNINILDLVKQEDSEFNSIINKISEGAKSNFLISQILKRCRIIILQEMNGQNLLSYLLYKIRNEVIKAQLSSNIQNLNALKTNNGALPFENLPLFMNPKSYNSELSNLIHAINDFNDRKDELFARKIKNETITNKKIFNDINNLVDIEKINIYINNFNKKLDYPTYKESELFIYKEKYVYMHIFLETTLQIMDELNKKSLEIPIDYNAFIIDSLNNNSSTLNIENESKRKILEMLFKNSRIALIYGPAGTGKTFLANVVSNIFDNFEKIYLSTSNSAIQNLKKKMQARTKHYLVQYLVIFVTKKW